MWCVRQAQICLMKQMNVQPHVEDWRYEDDEDIRELKG